MHIFALELESDTGFFGFPKVGFNGDLRVIWWGKEYEHHAEQMDAGRIIPGILLAHAFGIEFMHGQITPKGTE